jgi:hypothetical protein
VLNLETLLGFNGDKLDVMLRRHRVRDASDYDIDRISFHGNGGHVFLIGTVGCICHELLHFFTAADDRNAGAYGVRDYVAAEVANEKFGLHVLSSLYLKFIFPLA